MASLVAKTRSGKIKVTVVPSDGIERAPVNVGAKEATMTITLTVNGKDHDVEADPDTPLLYVLQKRSGAQRREIRLRPWPVRVPAP